MSPGGFFVCPAWLKKTSYLLPCKGKNLQAELFSFRLINFISEKGLIDSNWFDHLCQNLWTNLQILALSNTQTQQLVLSVFKQSDWSQWCTRAGPSWPPHSEDDRIKAQWENLKYIFTHFSSLSLSKKSHDTVSVCTKLRHDGDLSLFSLHEPGPETSTLE